MKSLSKIFFILLAVVASLSSCVTNKQTDLLQDIKLNHPQLIVKPDEYKVIPGDQLSIVVYAWDRETARMFSGYTPQFTHQGYSDRTGVDVGSQIRGLENT